MGVIKRQGIKGTIATYIGMAIGYFNFLWLAPYALTPEQIGLVKVIVEIGTTIGLIGFFGFNSSAVRFFPYFNNRSRKHLGFLFLFLCVSFCGYIIVSSSLLIFKTSFLESFMKKSPLVADYYYLFFPMAFFAMYYHIFETYSSLQFRIVVPNIIKEIFIRVAFSVLVILFIYRILNFDQLVQWQIVSYGIALIIIILYIKKLGYLFLQKDFSVLKGTLKKEIVTFSLYQTISASSGFLLTRLDIIMVTAISGLANTGVYSIGFLLGSIIEVPRRSIAQISLPIISDAMIKGNMEKVKEMYAKTSINQLLISGFFFLLLWSNIDTLFSFVPNSQIYATAKAVVFLIGFSRFLDALTGSNSEIIGYSKYFRFNLIMVIFLSLTNILTNYLLIKSFGIYGAALSIVIYFFLFNLIKYLFIWKKFHIQPFTASTAKALLLFGSILLIDYLIKTPAGIGYLIFKTVLITTVFWGVVLSMNISEDIEDIYKNGLKSIF